MREREMTTQMRRFGRDALKEIGVKVVMKDMILLESGFMESKDSIDINYLMVEYDEVQYQIYSKNGNTTVEVYNDFKANKEELIDEIIEDASLNLKSMRNVAKYFHVTRWYYTYNKSVLREGIIKKIIEQGMSLKDFEEVIKEVA